MRNPRNEMSTVDKARMALTRLESIEFEMGQYYEETGCIGTNSTNTGALMHSIDKYNNLKVYDYAADYSL